MNKAKKTPIKPNNDKGSKSLKIEIDYSKSPSAHYSNYAGVAHSLNELFIDFCLVAPPYNVNADQQIAYAQPLFRIIIPTIMAPALVDALQTQIAHQTQAREQFVAKQPKNKKDSDV